MGPRSVRTSSLSLPEGDSRMVGPCSNHEDTPVATRICRSKMTWMYDVPATVLLLLLVTAAASAMVIGDGGSTEVPGGSIDIETDTSNSTSSMSSSSPPPSSKPSSSGVDALKKIGWGCGLVTPVSNISLEAIMGRWYLAEIIAPSGEQRQDACAGVDFWRWDDEENNLMPEVVRPPVVGPHHLVMRGFNRHGKGKSSSYRVDTASIVEGSGNAVWDQPAAMGASVAVLDFTTDQRFLTVSTCVRALTFEWTSVLARDPNATLLHRDELHQHLRAAGLRYVDGAVLQDNTGCVYR